ncbi:MAG: hypothetical protein KAT62_12100 [Desulfuromonadales bacterium]|nr:hypothetical protein [Desulfuromonadales bacterium]
MTQEPLTSTKVMSCMVKRLLVICAIGFVLASTNVAVCYGQGVSVEFYQTEINSSNQADVLLMKNYVRGALDGIQFTNALLISNNQTPIFCPPQDLGLSTNNAIQIIDYEITTMPVEKNANITILLLLGLQRAFPCTK